MKKLFAASLTALVACASVTSLFVQNASAQTKLQSLEQRQANQEQRIQQGVQSGRITPKEAKKLERREAKIRKLEAKYQANGKMSNRQSRKLERRINRADRSISKAEHNRSHL